MGEIAMQLMPKSKWTHWKVSMIYQRMNRMDDCIAHLAKALEINPSHRFARKDWERYCNEDYVPRKPDANIEHDYERKENTNSNQYANENLNDANYQSAQSPFSPMGTGGNETI